MCELKSNESFNEKPGEIFKEVEEPSLDQLAATNTEKRPIEIEQNAIERDKNKKRKIPISNRLKR